MQTKVQSRLIQFWEAGNFYKGHSHPRVNPTFKFADAPIFIRFSEQSVFYEVAETNEPIQKESFRFRKYDELMSLANTDTKTYLLDIICEVRGIKTIYNKATHGTQRLMATI
ncbi:unnamed protein product [Brassica oleracea]